MLEALSPSEQAQLLYDSLVAETKGNVTAQKAVQALQSWGFPADCYVSLERMEADAPVKFPTFFRAMQSAVGAFRTPGLSAIARSDRERADAIFDLLDLDGSGEIEISELKVLLVSWGMTLREADHTCHVHDIRGNGLISRDNFFRNFVPVWRYAWDEIKDSVRRNHRIEQAKHVKVPTTEA